MSINTVAKRTAALLDETPVLIPDSIISTGDRVRLVGDYAWEPSPDFTQVYRLTLETPVYRASLPTPSYTAILETPVYRRQL